MDYVELLALVKDNAEATTFIQGVQATQATNVQTINGLELKVNEANTTRDKYKQGNSLIKSKLGLEQVNEDTVNAYLESVKGKNVDEKSQLEINTLKDLMANNKTDFESKSSVYINEIRDLKSGSNLQNLIGKSGMIDDALARGDMQKIVKSQMSYNDKNEAIFLGDNGVTKYNADGSLFGVNDAISEALIERAYWQGTTVKSGGGSQSNSNGGQNLTLTEQHSQSSAKSGFN